MKRLIEKTVFSGLVMACRLATWPTSTSPSLAKATTEGVSRLPSWLGITVGVPPSMTATTEFVVPRSMPITFAIASLLSWSRRSARVRSSGDRPLEPARDLGLGLHVHDTVDLAAAPQHEQRGNAARVEARGGGRVLVDVELADLHAAGELSGQLLDHRREHPAGPAPRRPQVEQHGQRRGFGLAGEVGVGDDDGRRVERQGPLAAPAHGMLAGADGRRRHAVGRAARRAADEGDLSGRCHSPTPRDAGARNRAPARAPARPPARTGVARGPAPRATVHPRSDRAPGATARAIRPAPRSRTTAIPRARPDAPGRGSTGRVARPRPSGPRPARRSRGSPRPAATRPPRAASPARRPRCAPASAGATPSAA